MTPKTPVAARNSRSRRRPTRREEREGRRLFQQPRLSVVVSLLLFFSLSSSRDDETHRNSFGGIIRFARAKAKLNIKSSGIDMVHASHILCGQNRTLCEDVMEWLEPLAENEAMRPKLEMGFEELARRFSRCPTGKRNGGDLGYFPRGEMTKDFDGTRGLGVRMVLGAHPTRRRLSVFSHRVRVFVYMLLLRALTVSLSLFSLVRLEQPSSSRNSRRRCTNRSGRTKRPTGST